MRPAPFLLWTAAALLLCRSACRRRRRAAGPAPSTARGPLDAGRLGAAAGRGGAIALVDPQGHRPLPHASAWGWGRDDESYHLAAMAAWHRFGDLRMIKFSMGDTSTTFYPVLGEVCVLGAAGPLPRQRRPGPLDAAPVRPLLRRWSTAAIGRRLGLSRRSALLRRPPSSPAIRRVLPVLALSAGNDHSASFFTLAAVDGVLALARRPTKARRSTPAPPSGCSWAPSTSACSSCPWCWRWRGSPAACARPPRIGGSG